jgi:purine-nucleoside phosphorylase
MMTQTLPHQAIDVIRQQLGDFTPRIGIVLGSGLGDIVNKIENKTVISYQDLPGFPEINVAGHGQQLVLGEWNGVPVALLHGRSHYYEAVSFDAVKTYVRTLKLLGCEMMLATNASGSMRPEVGPGEIVFVNDHINMLPNPLAGPNDDEFGPRFPPLDNAYDPHLREVFSACARDLKIPLHDGVYICVSGPSYETAAEIKAFHMMGANVVGMSTVPEVIVARHCGLKVAVLSMVTNLATGFSDASHDHNEVVNQAAKATPRLIKLLEAFVARVS